MMYDLCGGPCEHLLYVSKKLITATNVWICTKRFESVLLSDLSRYMTFVNNKNSSRSLLSYFSLYNVLHIFKGRQVWTTGKPVWYLHCLLFGSHTECGLTLSCCNKQRHPWKCLDGMLSMPIAITNPTLSKMLAFALLHW